METITTENLNKLSLNSVASLLLFFVQKIHSQNSLIERDFFDNLFLKSWDCLFKKNTSNKLYDDFAIPLSEITDNLEERDETEKNIIQSILFMFYYFIWTVDGMERYENPLKPLWGSALGDIDDTFFFNAVEYSLNSKCDSFEENKNLNIIYNYILKTQKIEFVGLVGNVLTIEDYNSIIAENV